MHHLSDGLRAAVGSATDMSAFDGKLAAPRDGTGMTPDAPQCAAHVREVMPLSYNEF